MPVAGIKDAIGGATPGRAFIATGAGTKLITGDPGNETFVLPIAGQGLNNISGFTEWNRDVLDLRPALARTNWDQRAATLGNYLKVTDSAGSATLAIAATGSGAGTVIATLTGSGSLGLNDLIGRDSLLT